MHLIAAHCSLQLVIMLQIFPMIEVDEKTTKHWLEVVGKPTFGIVQFLPKSHCEKPKKKCSQSQHLMILGKTSTHIYMNVTIIIVVRTRTSTTPAPRVPARARSKRISDKIACSFLKRNNFMSLRHVSVVLLKHWLSSH